MRALLSLLCVGSLFCGASCTTAPSRNTETPPTFGPVRERVLPFGAPCSLWLFQFRNGEVFASGRGPGTTPEQAAEDHKTIDNAGGVDMCAHGGKSGFQLVGEACLFARDPHGIGWDGTTAKQVVAKMQHVDFERPSEPGATRNPFAPATGGGFGVTQLEVQDLPITYLFRTVRGEVGILEILDIVEDKRGHSGDGRGYGMTFRYRMVGKQDD